MHWCAPMHLSIFLNEDILIPGALRIPHMVSNIPKGNFGNQILKGKQFPQGFEWSFFKYFGRAVSSFLRNHQSILSPSDLGFPQYWEKWHCYQKQHQYALIQSKFYLRILYRLSFPWKVKKKKPMQFQSFEDSSKRRDKMSLLFTYWKENYIIIAYL